MDLDKIQFKKFFPIFIFLNCQIKLKIFFLSIYQVGTNCEPDVDRVRLSEQTPMRSARFLGRALDMQIFSRIDRLMKMVNSEYYHEHGRTCNVLIMVTYLTTSKLNYLLINCESFN